MTPRLWLRAGRGRWWWRYLTGFVRHRPLFCGWCRRGHLWTPMWPTYPDAHVRPFEAAR